MIEQSTGDKLKVFVSYSRRDLEFADQLVAILEWQGFHVIIDRKGIHGAEKWEERLAQLILEADTVLFVLSPDSAVSDVCKWEVEEAARRAKRIVPLVCRPLDGAKPHELLRDLNYIYFYADKEVTGSGFGTGQVRLIEALKIDVGWLREHTRLEELAARWHKNGRVPDLLVRGYELNGYRAWRDRRPANAPDLTSLQRVFLGDSEAEEEKRASAERKRLDEIAAVQSERQKALDEARAALQREEMERAARTRARRVIQWGSGAVAAAVVATALGFAALQQRNLATQKALTATAQHEKSEADKARAQQEILTKTAQQQKEVAVAARADATTKSKQLVQFLGEIRRANMQTAEHQFTGAFGSSSAGQRPMVEVKPNPLTDEEIYARMKLPTVGTGSECAESKDALIGMARAVLKQVPSASTLPPEQFRAFVSALPPNTEIHSSFAWRLDTLIQHQKYSYITSQLRAIGWIGRHTDVPIEELARSEESAFAFDTAFATKNVMHETVPAKYPFADTRFAAKSQGAFSGGYPRGAVVHFTAGRNRRDWTDAEATVKYLASIGHGVHFIISPSGQIYQTLDLGVWGHHAGLSTYPGLGDRVSQFLVGIELLAAGLLRRSQQGYEPWWNKPDNSKNTDYKRDEVRFATEADNIRTSGYYQKFTRAQEIALTNLILWLKRSRPDIFSFDFVVGHDEVSPGRKDDPGGALSMTMPEYRRFLHRIQEAGVSAVDGEFFEEWRSSWWNCKPGPAAARNELNRGIMLLDEGRVIEVEAALKKARSYASGPQVIDAAIAKVYIKRGKALLDDDPAASRAQFGLAQKLAPGERIGEVHALLAKAFHREGRLADSLQSINRAVSLEPSNSYYLGLRGFFQLMLGRIESACADGDAAATDKSYHELDVVRGRCLEIRGNKDSAIAKYLHVLDESSFFSKEGMAARELAEERLVGLLETASEGEAVAQLERLVALNTKNADEIRDAWARIYLRRGNDRLAAGKLAEARSESHVALKGVTGDLTAELHEFVARTWHRQDRPAEALAAIQKAIAHDSGDPRFLTIRGLLHAALGQIEQACADTEAIDENETSPEIYAVRGRCFEGRGDKVEAIEAYRRTLEDSTEGGDEYSVRKLARERLEALGVTP